jgi:osmotically-inducible protein OsmY
VKSDLQLEQDVRAELSWDQNSGRLAHATQIAVAADGGIVTLRGTVGSFSQRRAAVKAAKRVLGTVDVDDRLQVRLMDEWARDDAEIRGAALQALEWNTEIPADRIDVKVDLGELLLKGNVDWHYQKEAAEAAVSGLAGVVSVKDEIAVNAPMTQAEDLAGNIEDAFERGAQTHANGISVTVLDGNVRLEGRVRSWAEHDEAMATASAAPGVREVTDLLVVSA